MKCSDSHKPTGKDRNSGLKPRKKGLWVLFLFLCFSICFCACRHQTDENKKLEQIQRLCENSPDSAHRVLAQLKEPEKLPKSDYACWCLYYNYIQFKLGKSPDINTLSIAANFYKSTSDTYLSGLTCFLKGFYYWEKGQKSLSMVWLKEAEQLLLHSTDFKLRGMVASYIALNYTRDELYHHALEYNHQALSLFLKVGSERLMAYAYREMADEYYQLGYPADSVMYYSNKAMNLSHIAGDSLNYYSVLLHQGVYLRETQPTEAKQKLLAGVDYFPKQKKYYAAYLASVYATLQQNDSAQHYLAISLNDTVNSSLRVLGQRAAAQIAFNQKNYRRACEYMNKVVMLRDSTNKATLRNQLRRIDKQYDLTNKEKENTILQQQNTTKIFLITLLVISCLLLSIIFIVVRYRIKRKNSKLQLRNQQLEFERETMALKNEQKREMLQLKLKENLNNTLKFDRLKRTFDNSSRNNNNPDKKNEFYKELAHQSMLSQDLWDYYIEQVDLMHDNRIELLRQTYPALSKTDLIVIALSCLEISLCDSLILLKMNKNTMYVRRKTIKKRLELDAETDLTEWLYQYIGMKKTSQYINTTQ